MLGWMLLTEWMNMGQKTRYFMISLNQHCLFNDAEKTISVEKINKKGGLTCICTMSLYWHEAS